MSPKILGTCLLGGIAALDATPVAQTLMSQPLVTASLLGLLWGQWLLAIKVGIVLQVFAAGTLPVGARTPEDYAIGGVIGTGVALMLGASAPFAIAQDASAMLGVLAGLVSATAGVPLIKWQRRRNEALGRWCEREVTAGREEALGQAQVATVGLAFAVGVASCAAFLAAGAWAMRPWVLEHSVRLARAWNIAQPLWLGFGLAHLLNAFVQRRYTRVAVFGLGLVVAWILLFSRGL